jgi:hypothetical protein
MVVANAPSPMRSLEIRLAHPAQRSHGPESRIYSVDTPCCCAETLAVRAIVRNGARREIDLVANHPYLLGGGKKFTKRALPGLVGAQPGDEGSTGRMRAHRQCHSPLACRCSPLVRARSGTSSDTPGETRDCASRLPASVSRPDIGSLQPEAGQPSPAGLPRLSYRSLRSFWISPSHLGRSTCGQERASVERAGGFVLFEPLTVFPPGCFFA